uniref:Uncharacterized protein n=1 Tax=Arundo donax TaxID=35708 RepID=A0A0A8Y098_ARUDO
MSSGPGPASPSPWPSLGRCPGIAARARCAAAARRPAAGLATGCSGWGSRGAGWMGAAGCCWGLGTRVQARTRRRSSGWSSCLLECGRNVEGGRRRSGQATA